MLTTEQKQQFHKDGYLLVPGVLTKEEVASLRTFVRPIFDLPPDQRYGADHEKLVFFLACSTNSLHVKAHHDFLTSRPNYIYLQDFRYPPDLLEQAKKAGVTLV